MNRQTFEGYITEAVSLVPVHIRARIENVAFVIDDERTGRLFGLYHGIPLTRRGQGYSGVLPDKITIYRRTIENAGGGDPAAVRKLVIDTVHHEIAHYFGFSETKVRRWEKHRRSKHTGEKNDPPATGNLRTL